MGDTFKYITSKGEQRARNLAQWFKRLFDKHGVVSLISITQKIKRATQIDSRSKKWCSPSPIVREYKLNYRKKSFHPSNNSFYHSVIIYLAAIYHHLSLRQLLARCVRWSHSRGHFCLKYGYHIYETHASASLVGHDSTKSFAIWQRLGFVFAPL